MVSPGEFIPVAEDCGLIVPLGDWMLEQVCLLLNDPRVRAAGYSLSVNVSPLQFQHADFVEKVKSAIQRTGIDPRKLTLEVTESLLLSDVDHAIQKMVNLVALGVQFALDDFGTGYSSLAYLMRLPIQELKLDQVFIRDLRVNAESRVLVEAILMLAKAKGLRVVAEGVEELEQAELLRALEPSILCQGYWFSRPVLAEDWMANPALAQH
ncbi:MAG: EAL domain-containing protein, partial [Comamonas sp.]